MHSQLHTRTSTFLSYKRLLSRHGLSSAMTKAMAENPSLLKGKFLCQKDTLPFRIFRPGRNETKQKPSLQNGIFVWLWSLSPSPPFFFWWLLPWAFVPTMLYWWLLTLSHSWVSGNYVVHFSSGQGLQPETKTTGSQRPRPRPAVNLSVSGHRFQCQLPGVGDATGS